MNDCVVCYIVDQQKATVAHSARECGDGAPLALLDAYAAIVVRQYLVLGIALERNFPKDTSQLCDRHAADVAASFRDFAGGGKAPEDQP